MVLNFNLAAMKKYIISITLLVFVFSSCQKDATNVKLPPAKIQLVLQSFISPQDSLIKVYVTESTPIFGQTQNTGGYNCLKDAKVEIIHNSIIYNILYDANENAYIIDSNQLKIIAGDDYSIKVTRGNETVTGSCTVPFPLSFDLNLDKIELNAEIDPQTKDTINVSYRLATSFTDLLTPSDYYRVYINSYSTNWEYLYDNQGNIVDSFISDHSNLTYFENGDQEYISDTEYDRMKILQNSTVFLSGGRSASILSTKISLGIMHTDVNYYKYQTSAIAHLNNQGNPFAEPSLVFTNIQGGLGIFAAYNYRYWTKNL